MSKEGKDIRDLFIESEANNYYKRNKNLVDNENYVSKGTKILDEFIVRNNFLNTPKTILEIGCCSGYNLRYLCGKYEGNLHGVGIEPSINAIEEGRRKINSSLNIELRHGTSDFLDFEDESFDIVLIGFCLFCVDRKYIFKTIAEVDRVLKTNGIIVLEDFDTSIPYLRENKHNNNVQTYKMNYSKLFLANPQYYMLENRSYSHEGLAYHTSIQERVSTSIIYKEEIMKAYHRS